MIHTLNISTPKRDAMLDITHMVQQYVDKTNLQDGYCIIYVPHTTAGLTINENADPDVQRDMLYALDKAYPRQADYRHFEGNSAAHIKASTVGFQQTVLINAGKLLLGRWQGIYFCEFDGPRQRQVFISIFGEK
ncbi:secondary thiamine-phosphate synthase enzyme YjbQ [Cellulosilyticum sp. I15G10I2]|uniref:secondary thiamine-phosphate synthase enzyme YjbQ n=1 Tax=Cellulosilyticum sp. I15G10I2 TaxID=1892843 RepID=UPI00085C2A51|nr:secondary thiamine-phosphate synthase enzyme YjbQ [Cellulosilyticum sp. I15G10I2]